MYDDVTSLAAINLKIAALLSLLARDQEQVELDHNSGYYVYVMSDHALCLRRALERRQQITKQGVQYAA